MTKEKNYEEETIFRKPAHARAAADRWWLCSQGDKYSAAFVGGESGVVYAGGSDVGKTLGVRPALQLDLSKVTFDSTSNTFSVGSSSVAVTGLIAIYAPAGGTTETWCTQAGILFVDEKRLPPVDQMMRRRYYITPDA